MAAPASLSATPAAASVEPVRHALPRDAELRLEVGDAGASVKLLSGSAEIFGVEMAEGRQYTLSPGRKLAIFTWSGAELQVSSGVEVAYISTETTLPVVANLHQRLEARRDEARAIGGPGPRIMVVGPTDSGKSTLCRTLCAYACRVGRVPTYVDLDLGQGDVSIPGAIAATPLDRTCLSVEEGVTGAAPLVHYFANATPSEYLEVYKNAVQRLGDAVNRRLDIDAPARVAGLVVNTMGWVEGAGYDLLLHAVAVLHCDVIAVMGHDRVFAKLSEDARALRLPPLPRPAGGAGGPGPASPVPRTVTVVKLARAGGAVERSRDYRRGARKSRVREYFYGPHRGPGQPPALSPSSITVPFDAVTIVRVGGLASEAGILPIGKTSTLDPLRTVIVPPGPSIVGHVLGVSFATAEKQVPHANVAGFVHVTSVNSEARTFTMLAPSGGPLPSRYLIAGSITWTE